MNIHFPSPSVKNKLTYYAAIRCYARRGSRRLPRSHQRHGCAADMERDAALEAQPADEDHRADDQVAGLRQINLVLDNIPDTDGGDHAVEHEGNAADD